MTSERDWDRANTEAGIMPLSEYVRKYGAEPGKGTPGSREESHRRQMAQREAANSEWSTTIGIVLGIVIFGLAIAWMVLH